jgi:FtsP/CotA-like multicopper oxidase with cupredoxin domain
MTWIRTTPFSIRTSPTTAIRYASRQQVLLRIIGQGRWQHPFHEHGNHVRILGRDGNLILSSTTAGDPISPVTALHHHNTPGLAMDGIFYWTGRA